MNHQEKINFEKATAAIRAATFDKKGGVTVEDIYRRLKVNRWHRSGYLNQNNGEHTAGMLALLTVCHKKPSKDLFLAILMHDLHEYDLGDIPAQAKMDHPALRELDSKVQADFVASVGLSLDLSKADKKWLKFLDDFEAYMFLNTYPGVLESEVREILEKLHRIVTDRKSQLKKVKPFEIPPMREK